MKILLPFDLFQVEFNEHRIVMIPPNLDAKHRERFLDKLSAAVKQQAELATQCDAILSVTGEIDIQADRVLIPHEPARHGNREALCDKNTLPEIELLNWVGWSLLRALEAAAPGIPHGGVQVSNLYQDEQGRIKLGDFGIAPAYEAICSDGGRRQVHCGASRWAILGEDEGREHGWIAPYFSHELLEGEQRLNPKADQFAAGVLLYMLGTGTHPYGGDFGDPTQMLYFYLEPFAIEEERPEWARIFERARGDLKQDDDKPVLAWSRLVQKLLASDPGERYAHPQEGLVEITDYGPQTWGEATEIITTGLRQLEAGDVEPLLAGVKPYTSNEALPPRWREQLSAWLSEIETRKDEIGACKRLRLRLSEGQAALNNVEVEQAREIAREVLASPRCDDVLRANAEELISYCDEQEAFVESGADDLAKAYLESASEYQELRDFTEAREILYGVINDPAMPKTRADQARRMLTEIELAEQRLEQQRLEIAGTKEDWSAGHYDAARQRLKALLGDEGRADDIAAEAEALLEQVTKSQKLRAEYVAELEHARNAWERADLDALGRHLALVPEDLSDTKIADVRADFARRQDPLRAGLALRAALSESLETDKPEAGLIKTRSTEELDDIPQILRDELNKLHEQCQERVDEKERVRIDQVLSFVKKARAELDQLEVTQCRQRLERQVVPQTGLPEDVTRQTEDLFAACERVTGALKLFEYAQTHLEDGDYDGGLALLDKFNGAGLPAALGARNEALREELIRARRARERQELQIASAEVEKLETRLELGQFKEAAQTLADLESTNGLTDELRSRIDAVAKAISAQQKILDVLDAAEVKLTGNAVELEQVRADLDGLPKDVPNWAAARVDAYLQQINKIAEQRKAATTEEAGAALDAAAKALRSEDLSSARKHLETARGGIGLDADLADRHERLATLATQLEEWLPRIHDAAAIATKGELLEADRLIREILGSETLPDCCRAPATDLQEQIQQQSEAQRTGIDKQLAELEAELNERGRRARKFRQRVGAVSANSLVTDLHRSKCHELLTQWQCLEEPKKTKTWQIVAASAAAMIIAGLGLYWGGLFGDAAERPNVPAAVSATTNTPEVAVEIPVEPDISPINQPSAERTENTIEAEPGKLHMSADLEPIKSTEDEAIEDEKVAVKSTTESDNPARQVAATTEPAPLKTQPELETVTEKEPEQTADEETEPAPVVPTLEELSAEYIEAIRKALPPEAEFEELSSNEDEPYSTNVSWRGRQLLPLTGLRFDEQTRVFEPAAVEVADYFGLQIEVLKTIDRPVELALDPHEKMPALYRITPVQGLGLSEVDPRKRTARVTGMARLINDRRSDTSFTFTASYSECKLFPDQATREAYAEYLSNLQATRLRAAARTIDSALKLPEGMQVEIPAEFTSGPNGKLTVTGAGSGEFARLDVSWNAELLQYETDLETADIRLHQGMRRILADGRAQELLEPEWACLKTTLLPVEDQIRRNYLENCELLKVVPLDQRMREPLTVAIDLTVGPQNGTRRVVIPGSIIMSGGVPVWDTHGNERARAAIETQLADLTLDLEDRLALLVTNKNVTEAELHAALSAVAEEKIKRYGVNPYRVSESFTSTTPVESLIAVSADLQDLTTDDKTSDAFPVVFIEYYIGEQEVYGLSWHAATDEADNVNGVGNAKIWQVMPTAQLYGYAGPKQFRQAYATDADLGERLLGAALGQALERSSGGVYGVVIAPDGPLWLTRWDQVRFAPRSLKVGDLRGEVSDGQVSALRAILREGEGERKSGRWRVGLWCVPTLAGQWQGAANQIDDFDLGVLVPGKKPVLARFKQMGELTFATITDPTLAGDFAWAQFARDVRKAELGYRFWNRQWHGEAWQPTPFVSFSLIQTR